MGNYILDSNYSWYIVGCMKAKTTSEKADKIEFPETLQEAVNYFADADRALKFMVALRWPDGVVKCARCGDANVVFMKERRIWRCRACKKQFSAKVGTIFE